MKEDEEGRAPGSPDCVFKGGTIYDYRHTLVDEKGFEPVRKRVKIIHSREWLIGAETFGNEPTFLNGGRFILPPQFLKSNVYLCKFTSLSRTCNVRVKLEIKEGLCVIWTLPEIFISDFFNFSWFSKFLCTGLMGHFSTMVCFVCFVVQVSLINVPWI